MRKLNYDPIKAKKQWKCNKYSTPELAECRRLMSSYGISKGMRDHMAATADNKCEICNLEMPLVVDHDHSTCIVRGMLCSKCNRGLGHFDDNIDLLTKALMYIKLKSEQNNTYFKG